MATGSPDTVRAAARLGELLAVNASVRRSGSTTRSVLHVLPHPGGGGETYVNLLERMEGYRLSRLYLWEAPPGRATVDRLLVARRALALSWRARRYDLLHVHGETAGALLLPALASVRSVVTLHGLHVLRRTRGVAHNAARLNLRLLVRTASAAICVSRSELADTRAVVGERAARRLRLVQNGIDPLPAPTTEERDRARKRLGLEPTALVGAFVGGLDAHKNPLLAVRATVELARRGRPVELLVAGDGPLLTEAVGLAATPGGSVVHMLGHQRDVRPVLAAADFFVLPSHREGLSFSLLEAMSLGLVPIVSDAPGNPETVGDAGIVVARGDLEGFVTAFERLVGSEAERRALSARAAKRVREHFQADAMVAATLRLYDEVAKPADAAADAADATLSTQAPSQSSSESARHRAP